MLPQHTFSRWKSVGESQNRTHTTPQPLEFLRLFLVLSRNCWYQSTVKGGREGRDIDVVQLVTVCEKLGAGEILLNCMDKDGTNSGYDLELTNMVEEKVTIPVIASSGAGKVEHFCEVFNTTNVEAALVTGIFHRKEVPISDVKKHLQEEGLEIR